MKNNYYIPSGHVGIREGVVFVIASFIVAFMVGFAYVYASSYMPLIYICALLALGFPFACARVGDKITWKLSIQHPTFVKVAILAAVIVGFYYSWCLWVSNVAAESDIVETSFRLFVHPLSLWGAMLDINAIGTWSIHQNVVRGIELGIIWIGEALMVLRGAWYFSGKQAMRPFSQYSHRWSSPESTLWLSYFPPKVFLDILSTPSLYMQLFAVGASVSNSRLVVYECDGGYYADLISKVTLANGKTRKKTELQNIQIPAELYQLMKTHNVFGEGEEYYHVEAQAQVARVIQQVDQGLFYADAVNSDQSISIQNRWVFKNSGVILGSVCIIAIGLLGGIAYSMLSESGTSYDEIEYTVICVTFGILMIVCARMAYRSLASNNINFIVDRNHHTLTKKALGRKQWEIPVSSISGHVLKNIYHSGAFVGSDVYILTAGKKYKLFHSLKTQDEVDTLLASFYDAITAAGREKKL